MDTKSEGTIEANKKEANKNHKETNEKLTEKLQVFDSIHYGSD